MDDRLYGGTRALSGWDRARGGDRTDLAAMENGDPSATGAPDNLGRDPSAAGLMLIASRTSNEDLCVTCRADPVVAAACARCLMRESGRERSLRLPTGRDMRHVERADMRPRSDRLLFDVASQQLLGFDPAASFE